MKTFKLFPNIFSTLPPGGPSLWEFFLKCNVYIHVYCHYGLFYRQKGLTSSYTPTYPTLSLSLLQTTCKANSTFRNTYTTSIQNWCSQGGILSHTFFNIYNSAIPTPLKYTQLITYTDNITVIATHSNIQPHPHSISDILNQTTFLLNSDKRGKT